MKKLIMFFMVLMLCLGFVGEAKAQPVCLVVCTTNAGDGDEVTVMYYDENDEWIDLRELEYCTLGFGELEISAGEGLDVTSGDGVFTITQEMLDSDTFNVYTYPPAGWYRFSLAHPEWEAPFDTVAEAVAAGGSCAEYLSLSCGAAPAIAVDSNDIYEPQDAGGPPAEGNQRDLLWVSLAWRPGEPTYPAFTAYVKVDPNEGDAPHEDFTFINPPPDPNGNVYLTYDETNWDVPQYVTVEAVADLDREGDENYPIELTVTINIADPNFGNPTPVVVESSVGVVDNDVPFVSAIPDPIEISENDPCTCVDLKVRLSHLPTHDVYVRVEPYEWAFEELGGVMAYLDPPLGEADDPNKLTFTVTGNPTANETTMTSNWDVEQTITVCPIDNDELKEAWEEWIEGEIWTHVFSEDVRYLAPWLNPDGSDADDPGTPDEEEESNGEADQDMFSVVLVQDNECGAIGFAPQDYNEDCSVGLGDFAHYYVQWLICTEPYDDAGDCGKYWELVEE